MYDGSYVFVRTIRHVLSILKFQHNGGNGLIFLRIDFLQRGESNVYSDLHEPVSTSVDYVNTGGTDVGIRVSELLNDMSAHSQGSLSAHIVFLFLRLGDNVEGGGCGVSSGVVLCRTPSVQHI